MKAKHILEFLNQADRERGLKKIFTCAFEETLRELGKEGSYSVSLTLVDKEEIHKLNLQYRDTDRPTDVLTFAFLEADVFNPDSIVDLGNILICPEIAREQAKTYSHPYHRELAFLFIHGLLHSFGYDHHRSKEEAEEMFALQNRILNNLDYDFYTSMNRVKKLLVKAQSQALCPYSDFHVGAVCLTKDGKYHIGFNIENSAYGDSMCAERVCLFGTYAMGYRKDDIVSLSIIGDSMSVVSPCGSCRQVMRELLHPYCMVHLFNKDLSKERDCHVSDLLPFAFTSEDLHQ